jgi:putative NADH-flavin reductase
MKIVIFGASGRTGSLLLEQALSEGHEVRAYVRKAGSISKIHPNLKVIVGNLNEIPRLKEAITGADACFSTLGGNSLTHHSPDIIEGIDCIVSIMEQEVVPRFIYLSTIGAGDSKYFMAQPIRFLVVNIALRVPIADHTINEQRIVKSKLHWIVVRPGGLNDRLKTNNLIHGSEKTVLKGNPGISRANVAAFMLQQLVDSKYVNKSVWLYE